MDTIGNALSRAISYFSSIGVADFLDIIIVAYLIYRVIWFVRQTSSHNIAKGIFIILLALWISGVFKLSMINYILKKAVELGLIALLILFQPELRRLLERMGSGLSKGKTVSGMFLSKSIEQTVAACSDMSDSKTGALIVFERNVSLNSVIATGTVINADNTSELIKNIFFNKAPLHDGAVIMRDGRIESAGCVLPLTQRMNLSKDLGMRHRAGIGMSEQSDAVVVIVSEETGAVSVAIDGMLKRHLSPESLSQLLSSQLISNEDSEEKHGLLYYAKRLFKVNDYEKHDENTI